MIFPYLLRLLCLCFAAFFLVHAVLSSIVWFSSRPALRLAEKMKPSSATTFLFALRMIPAALSLFAVLGLCVPSYLWLEPQSAAEQISFACFAAALLGLAIWTTAIARSVNSATKSLRYARQCQQSGRETLLGGEIAPVLVVPQETPLLALAGVIRPRLMVSRGVISALSAEQLDAALRHESAHRISRDNLKRLLLLLAPDIFPFSRTFAPLDRSWARLSEWAADDHAAGGDSRRALSLAGALVRVARMKAAPRPAILLTSLIEDDRDLSIRVDRLLHAAPSRPNPLGRVLRAALGGAALVLTGTLAAAVLWPSTLSSVHELLERLVH
jgi:Zn-dependent protease with chaperone function